MVDMLDFGYQSDPIAVGTIHESAVASMLNGTASDPDHQHATFSQLATHFECPSEFDEQLKCMRQVDQADIETYLQTYSDEDQMPPLAFSPIADNTLVFTPDQYVDKFASSRLVSLSLATVVNNPKLIEQPAILGFNSDEGATFVPYTSPSNPGVTQEIVKDLTLWEVQCAVITAARQRIGTGVSTYFYYYSGNFTNISPE